MAEGKEVTVVLVAWDERLDILPKGPAETLNGHRPANVACFHYPPTNMNAAQWIGLRKSRAVGLLRNAARIS